jgi:gluconokinase
VVDELDRVSPIRQIRATGGVFRSPVWREILAAALGRPLVVTDGADGTALGAAALALYGLGEAASLREALIMLGADPDAGSDELIPDPDDVAAYRAIRAEIPALLARYDEVRTLFS